jgi:4-aminobutyrate aminotransferase-like enzyme/Ser/Thr protein kinase RdoA (MazF antagonist)
MDLLQHTPSLTPETAAEIARDVFGLAARATPLPGERDQNFLLTTASAGRFVLKIANAADDRSILEAQNGALDHVARGTALCPRVVAAVNGSSLVEWRNGHGVRHFVRLLTWIPGQTLASVSHHSPSLLEDLGRKVAALDRALDGFDHPAVHRDLYWDLARAPEIIQRYSHLIADRDLRALVHRLTARIENDSRRRFDQLRRTVVHNDPNDYNVLVDVRDRESIDDLRVVGILDFGDIVHTYSIADLAIAAAYAVLDKADPLAAAAFVVRGYHTVNPLTDDERSALVDLIVLRLCASVAIAASQQAARPADEYLTISQRAIERTLPHLEEIDPGFARDTFDHLCDKAQMLVRRRMSIGTNVRLGYRDPVNIVRGSMQYLYDETGRRYLDAYNNVPHVGHCHPRVVQAAIDQMRVLNTNTRYLHDGMIRYAERLAATLPDPLSVCFFVNSGSEANELALRLARAHTKREGVIVLDSAYHGNTTTLVAISPYKFTGPGGEGQPPWVRTVPTPDTFRGAIKKRPSAGAEYAAFVATAVHELAADRAGVAAFIAESAPSVGGQIILPDGYLQAAYAAARNAGGLCIADEVQTAFGRLGHAFYAFEPQAVVPDIVVLGKPIGNGHPIGAVVTSPAIAASFDNGMEFFSTFGGNTVSCAVGLAVLDVLRDDKLQEQAHDVGSALVSGLQSLSETHALIGDVRGSGFFIGVELVRDRGTLEPATREAAFIVNRLREEGILLGTDGPFENVLKIRPPMPFTLEDAELLCRTLDRVLREI